MNELSWPLATEVSKLDLTPKVWQQITKDFTLEAIDFDVKAELTPTNLDHIYQLLYPIIKRLIEHDFSAISQLLYRMAISEERVAKHIALSPDDSAHAITYLMVCRECEKVLLRTQFSQGS